MAARLPGFYFIIKRSGGTYLEELNKTDANYWRKKINDYRDLPEKDALIEIFLRKHLRVGQKTASLEASGLRKSLSNLTLTRLKKFIYFLENREDQHSFDIPEEVGKFIKK